MKWLIGILFAAGLAMLIWRSLPPPEEVGRTTIRYMAWGNPEQLDAEMQLVKEFERRRPDIHVRLTLVPGSAYYQKLQIMLASGTAPDVYGQLGRLHEPLDLPALAGEADGTSSRASS
jgi:ABC-type glycerol-3-phosphate transport system substrate-binding protein